MGVTKSKTVKAWELSRTDHYLTVACPNKYHLTPLNRGDRLFRQLL